MMETAIASTTEEVMQECVTMNFSYFQAVSELAYRGKLTLETDPCTIRVKGTLETPKETIVKEAGIERVSESGDIIDPMAVVLLDLLRASKKA